MGKTELRLNVDAELLDQARRADVALEAAFEAGIKLALGQTHPSSAIEPDGSTRLGSSGVSEAEGRAEAWARDNADAIRSYNARIERRGVFGTDLRRW